jgi:hypothetical protein
MDEEAYVAHLEQFDLTRAPPRQQQPCRLGERIVRLGEGGLGQRRRLGGRGLLPQADQSRGRATGAGGLRLAALLNEVLGHVSPQEFRHY